MITGVQDIYYNVTDVAAAVDFYTQVLGMTVVSADKYWGALEIGGVSIGLHWSEGHEIPQIPRDAHGAHAGGTLTLASNDADADCEALRQKGVKILGTADAPWGKMVVFEDPDGNVLKLMQPKH